MLCYHSYDCHQTCLIHGITGSGKTEVYMELIEDTLSAGKEVLTLEEAARFMGVTKSSLYKMTHEQTIPYYKPNGKMVYFEKAELLTWIRRNAIASKAQVSEEANRILKNLSVK